MAKIKHVPRWLYTSVVLPPRSDTATLGVVELDPTIFMNDTLWPWELEHLTFYVPQAQMSYGGTAMLVEARVGMSGQCDINLVDGPIGILAGNSNQQRLIGDPGDGVLSRTHVFKYPYRLPKDDGFNVRIRYDSSTLGGVGSDKEISNPTVTLFGRTKHSIKPSLFMTSSLEALADGHQVDLYNADLMNDGEEDVDIYAIAFKGEQPLEGLLPFHYQVNPVTGVRWMPGEQEIPHMLLTPYGAFAQAATGAGTLNKPQSIQFPLGTKLRRRQRVRIQLRNVDDTNNIQVHMALFGYLEVQ